MELVKGPSEPSNDFEKDFESFIEDSELTLIGDYDMALQVSYLKGYLDCLTRGSKLLDETIEDIETTIQNSFDDDILLDLVTIKNHLCTKRIQLRQNTAKYKVVELEKV